MGIQRVSTETKTIWYLCGAISLCLCDKLVPFVFQGKENAFMPTGGKFGSQTGALMAQ